jgi:hypothetical protein
LNSFEKNFLFNYVFHTDQVIVFLLPEDVVQLLELTFLKVHTRAWGLPHICSSNTWHQKPQPLSVQQHAHQNANNKAGQAKTNQEPHHFQAFEL